MIWRRRQWVPVKLVSTRHLSSQFLKFNPLLTKHSGKSAVYTGPPRLPESNQYYAQLPAPSKWKSFRQPGTSTLFPDASYINAGDVVEVVSREGCVEFGVVTFSSTGPLFDMTTVHGQTMTCACADVTFALRQESPFLSSELKTLVARANLWSVKVRPYLPVLYAHYSLSHRCRAIDWNTVLEKITIYLGSPKLTDELALGVYFATAYEHLGFVRSRSLQAYVLVSTTTLDAINKVMKALTVQELERGAGELRRGAVTASIGQQLRLLLQHYAAWSDPRLERAVQAILSRVFPERTFEDGARLTTALQTILGSRFDMASAFLGPVDDIDTLPPIPLYLEDRKRSDNAGRPMEDHIESHTREGESPSPSEESPVTKKPLSIPIPVPREEALAEPPRASYGPPIMENGPPPLIETDSPQVFKEEDWKSASTDSGISHAKATPAVLVDEDLALAVSELGLTIYVPIVPVRSVLGSANALALKARTSSNDLGPRYLFTDASFRAELGLRAGATQNCLALSCPINVADGFWNPADVKVRTADVTIVKRTTTFFDANDSMDTRAIDHLSRVLNLPRSNFETAFGSTTPWPTLAGQWAAAYAAQHNISLPFLVQKNAREYPEEPSAAEPERLSQFPGTHELIGTSYAPVAFPFDSALALITQRQLVGRDLLPPPRLRDGSERPPLINKVKALVWTAHEFLSTVEKRTHRQLVLAELQDQLQQSEMFRIFRCTVLTPPVSESSPLAVVWCQELELEVEMLVLPNTKVFEGDQVLCTEILELDPLRGYFVLSM